MVMSRILSLMLFVSVACAVFLGNGAALATAVTDGAQSGITLVISMAGSLCLWSGVGKLMEHAGLTGALSRLIQPLLHRLFPSTRRDTALAGYLSGNICANFLGLGNAATPMGIQAVKAMSRHAPPATASDEMCRLVVLNTASIQLIPATVAAVRSSLGCGSPFDILPAVWVTSFCSAGLGITAAWYLGKVWRHD
ncbi:MAG: spore maturation protein A [Oscillospiraceae bacterium]|nr:spore maturation protein A [Oscillospiraceae bacterium]